jgi:hypothetical protein
MASLGQMRVDRMLPSRGRGGGSGIHLVGRTSEDVRAALGSSMTIGGREGADAHG